MTVSLRRSMRAIGAEYRARSARPTSPALPSGDNPGAHSAILRPRRNWTRGVAAQHASLSRWRSPVRIRSGPPSLAFPYAPSARPDGAFLCPRRGARSAVGPSGATSGTLRPRERGARCPSSLGVSLVVVAARGGLGVGRSSGSSAAHRVAERQRRAVGPARRRRRRRRPRTSRPAGRRSATPAPARRRRRRRPPVRARAGSPTSPIVPVTNFRTTATLDHDRRRSRPSWRGTSTRYDALELVEGEADAILAALGVDRPADASAPGPGRRRGRPSPATSPTNRKRLAFLRADAVGPGGARARAGATRRCSASTASRTSPTGRSTARAARPRPRAGATTRRRPGPSSPAATSCSTAASP